jgi:hypothetical protein
MWLQKLFVGRLIKTTLAVTYMLAYVMFTFLDLGCSREPIALVKLVVESTTYREKENPYNIHDDIHKKLVKGGFQVVSQGNESYDAIILLDYKEKKHGRYKLQGGIPGSWPGTMITCELHLKSKTGKTMILHTIKAEEANHKLAITDFKKSVYFEYFDKILASKFGTGDEVSVLISALEKNVRKNDKIRTAKEAAELLGNMKDKRAVVPLIEAAQRGYIPTRLAAIKALAIIGDAKAVSPLISALSHWNDDVRKEAAIALGVLKSSDATLALKDKAENDLSVEVQRAAKMALATINETEK